MLNSWANRFRLSQYVGSTFQYPRCSINPIEHVRAKHMQPSHLTGGTWLKDVGHNASLTAQMVRGLTAHAPIGHYRHRFKVGNQLEHCKHCVDVPHPLVENVPHVY